MKEKKRLEITFETHELTIVRFRPDHPTDFCAVCRSQTPHLSVAESASVLSLAEAEIFRLAESGQIHAGENADRRLRICGNSLAAAAEKDKKKE
jgi:hypothetical protein